MAYPNERDNQYLNANLFLIMTGNGATLNGLVHLSALVCLLWQITSAIMPAKKQKLTLFLLAYFIFLQRGERELFRLSTN